MLKITKATDPIEVKNVVVTISSLPGIGKTSTAFTASKPVLLDFDKGAYRAANRKDTVQMESWADVTGITADDLKAYDTVIVDTAGRALDCLTAQIITNPKMATRAGALSLQGYGELKAIFTTWTRLIRSLGKDVVLLCHADEQKNGDDLIERLDIQGGSKNEIHKASDAMGRLYLRNGKRFLNFSPTDTAFGKNPAQLSALEVPDFAGGGDFLAKTIATIKTALNKMSTDQQEAAAQLNEWTIAINECEDTDGFNALLADWKKLKNGQSRKVWAMIEKAAKEKGLTFKKGAGFVGAQAA